MDWLRTHQLREPAEHALRHNFEREFPRSAESQESKSKGLLADSVAR
jgi:hypothetical protein